MIVHAYGCLYTDMKETIDTVRFWKTFNINDKYIVSFVPGYLGCDYNTTSRAMSKLIYMNTDEPDDI